MEAFTKLGRIFYGLGIIAYGTHQIIIRDFRPQILPDFPHWVHTTTFVPVLTGILMIAAGVIVSGLFEVSDKLRMRTAFNLGVYFFALILLSHLPYLLFVYPHKLIHLGSWGDLLKGLAFSGGSFVMAGSFSTQIPVPGSKGLINYVFLRVDAIGRIFFCTTIILFGCNHFAYDLSFMVPSWFQWQSFWSYFGGAALIFAGVAILFNIFLHRASLLLAIMLFLWFVFLHVPGAIANPFQDRGNLVVSAFDALLFCGTALVLFSNRQDKKAGDKGVGIFFSQ